MRRRHAADALSRLIAQALDNARAAILWREALALCTARGALGHEPLALFCGRSGGKAAPIGAELFALFGRKTCHGLPTLVASRHAPVLQIALQLCAFRGRQLRQAFLHALLARFALLG